MTRRRLRARLPARPRPRPRARIVVWVGAAAQRAGLRGDPERLGAMTLAICAGALVGSAVAPPGRTIAYAAVGAFGAGRVIPLIERRAAARADEATAHALPDVLERLGSALRTGCSLTAALALVAPSTPGPLGVVLRDAVRAAALGASRPEVLATIGGAPGATVARVVATLTRCDRLGVPVADTVDALAADLRARARAAAETASRTAPVRMLFPLAFCFLPAFVLLTIAPIAFDALRTLGGIAGG